MKRAFFTIASLAAFVALLGGAACGSSSSSKGRACRTDADCPGAQICDPVTSVCAGLGSSSGAGAHASTGHTTGTGNNTSTTTGGGGSGGSSCTGPSCVCNAPEVTCPKGCANIDTDVNNCGSCGYPCPTQAGAKATCAAGMCGLACPGGGQMCNGQCTDTNSDPMNCGSCNNPCQPPQGGQATCFKGQCNVGCQGLTNCNGSCVDLTSDNGNCGACNTPCDAGQTGGTAQCTASKCVITCPAGQQVCNGFCMDVTSDPMNCGSCGNQCGAANFTNECKNSKCDCQSPVVDNWGATVACCFSNQCYINNQCTMVGCM